jgi:hypothetical protein
MCDGIIIGVGDTDGCDDTGLCGEGVLCTEKEFDGVFGFEPLGDIFVFAVGEELDD